eukprot:31398-Pelagococcus_subviridis.AAC.3
MRRAKSLRIGVHHANAVVWEPVYRTHLSLGGGRGGGVAGHLRERLERVDDALADDWPGRAEGRAVAFAAAAEPPREPSGRETVAVAFAGVRVVAVQDGRVEIVHRVADLVARDALRAAARVLDERARVADVLRRRVEDRRRERRRRRRPRGLLRDDDVRVRVRVRCIERTSLHRAPRDGHEIDAVPVPRSIGEVVPEVRPVHGHRLPVLQASNVLPDDLLVPERRPPVRPRLLLERLERPPSRRDEQRLPRHGVVVRRLRSTVHLGEEVGRRPVPRVLGVVAVEGADLVRGLRRASPLQVLLHRRRGGSVRFLRHDLLAAHDRELHAVRDRRALAAVREAFLHAGGRGGRGGGAGGGGGALGLDGEREVRANGRRERGHRVGVVARGCVGGGARGDLTTKPRRRHPSQNSECRDKQLRSRFRDLRPRRTVSSARQSPRAHGDLADRTATRVSPPRSPRTRDAHRSTRPPNARCWCARGPSPLEPASRVYHPRPLFRGRKERKRERATRERGARRRDTSAARPPSRVF